MIVIRCFVAILLTDEAKSNIYRVTEPFRQFPLDVKWVERENYHLTLKFLGSLDPSRVEKADAILAGITREHDRFALSYGGLGMFPHPRRPRVLWLSLAGDVESLLALQLKLEKGLVAAGFLHEEKIFRPHLTLGRFRSTAHLDAFYNKYREIPVAKNIGTFPVPELHLMESKLTPAGPHYTSLASYPLR